MPFVRIELLEGRTIEQKKEASQLITDAISKTMRVPPDDVRIIFDEFSLENFSKGGKFFLKEQ